MNLKAKSCTWLLLLICSHSYGQIEQYNYKRELKGITGKWHKVVLPNDIFGKVSSNLSDIRIFGINANRDTIEVPYLLRSTSGKVSITEVNFKTVNISKNENGYYFTFEIPTKEPFNQIELDFRQQNFDWRLKLEGSQNQQEWFTIVDDYRILSIINERTDFKFTKISFPDTRFHFIRLLIESKEKPDLIIAKVTQREFTDGTYRLYSIRKNEITENKKAKQTEIEIDLQSLVPVSYIKIGVKDTFDYYRAVTIKYLADSFKTEQGWIYRYNTLKSGTLNSIEENEFNFRNTILKQLKILIHNRDNEPLSIDTIEVKGYIHELVARFTEPATYFLTYGNSKAMKPQYDIVRFTGKIPKAMITLKLGNEQAIYKKELQMTEPLFKNRAWLWVVMTVIILLLGWFSVKMIKNN